MFAEGAAKALAATLVGEVRGTGAVGHHEGKGSCYIEFGADRIGRVDVDFLSGPSPTGTFQEPSDELRVLKERVRLGPPRPLVRPHDLTGTSADLD